MNYVAGFHFLEFFPSTPCNVSPSYNRKAEDADYAGRLVWMLWRMLWMLQLSYHPLLPK